MAATTYGDARDRQHRGEDEADAARFDDLVPTAVLQEAKKAFNSADFVRKHPKRCCMILTKLLYMMHQGQGDVLTGGSREASDVFFGVTKLFQSEDVSFGTVRVPGQDETWCSFAFE